MSKHFFKTKFKLATPMEKEGVAAAQVVNRTPLELRTLQTVPAYGYSDRLAFALKGGGNSGGI